MKIGVFGDSYADKGFVSSKNLIWYNFLQQEHGHDIECFGESGSSILFSAQQIKARWQDYDLVIWCLTTPGRFSLPHTINNRNVHVTTAWDQCRVDDVEIKKKHAVCIDYLKYIFDWETENFVGRAIVDHLTQQTANLMIVPCFPPPLDAGFNLYSLCEWEASFYFPGQTIPEIYEKYQDLRIGHLTQNNQKILAQLINQDLKPGIFQTNYENFQSPSEPIQKVFQLK